MFTFAGVAVTPVRIFNSALLEVMLSSLFISAALDVTPVKMFNSALLEVMPSSLFISAAEDVIAAPLSMIAPRSRLAVMSTIAAPEPAPSAYIILEVLFATLTLAPEPWVKVTIWPLAFLTIYRCCPSLGDTVIVFVPEGEPPNARTL